MKTRIISAFVGLILFFLVFLSFNTYVFNAIIGAIAVIGVYELLKATGINKHKALTVISLVLTALIPFYSLLNIDGLIPVVLLVVLFMFFGVFLIGNTKLMIDKIALALFCALTVSIAFSMLIFIRDKFADNSYFYVILVFAISWFADTGAYFTGCLIGKHKLAPVISPNKTVEGAIGGVVASILLSCLYAYICSLISHIQINYLYICIVAGIGSIVGMLGDLTASSIKRQYGVKDFGNLMPGHGGVMDRFDSVLFVAPLVYVFSQFFVLIK